MVQVDEVEDINFLSGNQDFTLKIEYEMLGDSNDIIWVATSDVIQPGST